MKTVREGDCSPINGVSFICGVRNVEDLILVPNTKWVIGSGFTDEVSGAWRAGCRPDWVFRNAQLFGSSGISGNDSTYRSKTRNRHLRPFASVRLVDR